MSDNKTHITYSAAAIQQYLSGKMTAAEMYALEKAALDDPFLEEAIEGYQAINEQDAEKALLELTAQLSATPVIAMQSKTLKWWKVAAAVLVLSSSIAVAFLFNNKEKVENNKTATITKPDDSLAVQPTFGANGTSKNEALFSDSIKSSTSINTPQLNLNQQQLAQLTPSNNSYYADSSFVYRPAEKKSETTLSDAADSYKAAEEEAVTDRRQQAASPSTQTNGTTVNNNLNAVVGFEGKETQQSLDYRSKNGLSTTSANNSFNAQVVNQNNKPLPFANVNVDAASAKQVTYADANGRFKISAPDSVVTVQIASQGYLSRKYNLKSDVAKNQIVLQDKKAETKDKATAKKREDDKDVDKNNIEVIGDSTSSAFPSDGWDKFNAYLANNIKQPAEKNEKFPSGEVELTFEVTTAGNISNIKISKSLCPACDAEAIRIVKDGPQWKMKKGKKGVTKITIKF